MSYALSENEAAIEAIPKREGLFRLPKKDAVVRLLAVAALVASTMACKIGGTKREGNEFWQKEGYRSLNSCMDAYYAVAMFGDGEDYCRTGDNGYGS